MASVDRAVPLAEHTTLRVGGPAQYFTTVSDTDAVISAVGWARQRQLPITIIGAGSNILAADTGVPGLVIKIAGGTCTYETLDDEQVRVRADAGMSFDVLVADTVDRGYWGLENLSHIPGTVGATPVQNVGAYGVEVADLLESVTVYDLTKEQVTVLPAASCGFAYRHSRFKSTDRGRYIVLQTSWLLQRQLAPRLGYGALQELAALPSVTPGQVRDAVIAIRATKFPDWHSVGTAGSFFMNPSISAAQAADLQQRYPALPTYVNADGTVKVALGWILDHVCGLRGHQVGAIGLHSAQALVLVHQGGADATAIDRFATEVAAVVYAKTGIQIQREVTALPA